MFFRTGAETRGFSLVAENLLAVVHVVSYLSTVVAPVYETFPLFCNSGLHKYVPLLKCIIRIVCVCVCVTTRELLTQTVWLKSYMNNGRFVSRSTLASALSYYYYYYYYYYLLQLGFHRVAVVLH